MPVLDPYEESGVYSIDSGIIYQTDANWTTGSSSWLIVSIIKSFITRCSSFINRGPHPIASKYLQVVPAGFGNLLRKIRDDYGNPPVQIFENGYSDTGELNDYDRISYYYEYISDMLTAIKEDGCNVVGYTIWSLMDNYEWSVGYT